MRLDSRACIVRLQLRTVPPTACGELSVRARGGEGDVRMKRHKWASRDVLHIVQIEIIRQILTTRYPDVVWMGEGKVIRSMSHMEG